MEASDTGTGQAAGATVELTQEQQDKISELDQLLADGVISQDQHDTARAKIEAGDPAVDPSAPPHTWGNTGDNLPPPPTEEETAAAAEAQSPGEAQQVPETRPQAFQGGADRSAISDASQRLDKAPAHGPEEIAAANSEENKAAADKASRRPNLEVGQRVQITGDHSEAGRMGHVLQIVYKDGIQELLSRVGSPERRFAEVLQYIVLTRDGRSDTLVATPDQVQPLEVNQGWGRGQI